MKSKDQWRKDHHREFVVKNSGKLAQKLRGLEAYQRCKQLFVAPAPILAQIRINALLDGKELVMPAPALKQGFFLLKPFSVPFPKLSFAVSLQGVAKYGSLIPSQQLAALKIELLVSEAICVNMEGISIGDGTGFFDLAAAILSEYGGLVSGYETLAVFADDSCLVTDELPADPWDVPLAGALTHTNYHALHPSQDQLMPLKVHWQHLSKKLVKKIDPLWKLSRAASVE